MLVSILGATIVAASAQAPAFSDAASRLLFERARAAVVHERSVTTLRSFVFRGRLRVSAADDQMVDGQVEMKILLPDRYLRVDSVAGVERHSGFAGARLLTPGGSLTDEKARFARFMLGVLAYAPPDSKLRLQSTGEGAFADTEAADVTGPQFSARLVVDAASHLPLRVVFFGERQVSTVVSFANRRPVEAIELPFRVTTQTPDRVLETLMFDEILVNPDLADDEFRRD
jgi:hypothetical protein